MCNERFLKDNSVYYQFNTPQKTEYFLNINLFSVIAKTKCLNNSMVFSVQLFLN